MFELIGAAVVGAIMGVALFGLCIAFGAVRGWWDGRR